MEGESSINEEDGASAGRVTAPMPSSPPHQTTYLTLGDGDFSYSVDLARYLAHEAKNSPDKTTTFVASGFDGKESLLKKYKDAPFLLKQLENFAPSSDDSESNKASTFQVQVEYNVNAIIPERSQQKNENFLRAQHVMFHHPHLGLEDAQRHQRFLCHLFHSATNHWMRPNGGVISITLADGQYVRWKCLEAANRHGLELLSKRAFVPPPAVDGRSTCYQHRRHQTGKSFGSGKTPESRVVSSETYTFGRKIDKEKYFARCLPWQLDQKENQIDVTTKPLPTRISTNIKPLFECPYCDKTFREERSRKCHLKDKHSDVTNNYIPESKKTKRSWECNLCTAESGDPRIFSSEQAMNDHVQAKHAGLHKVKIIPDWHHSQQQCLSQEETKSIPPSKQKCSICGLVYQSKADEDAHAIEFLPTEGSGSFACSFCSKIFKEKRAMLQHENFCNCQAA